MMGETTGCQLEIPSTKADRDALTRGQKTDWDAYYARPYRIASFSRSITGARIVSAIQRHVPKQPVIAELGGANSCFFELIRDRVRPKQYHIIDNNQVGLDQFRERHGDLKEVHLHREDVLSLKLPVQVDLALSVGLIEHFDQEGTREAIEAHFRILRPYGIALITFPTPTWLYRLTRFLSEACGAWIFHDERPLHFDEVEATAARYGTVLEKRIIWPIFLTQYHAIWQKRRDANQTDQAPRSGSTK